MRRTLMIAGLALVAAPSFAVDAHGRFTRGEIRAARRHPEMFQIDPLSIRLVELGPARPRSETPLEGHPPGTSGRGPAASAIDPGTVINIGKEIWQIIQDNKPVVDINQSYATAVPEGVASWNQLQGWKQPEGTVYEFSAGNLWGWTVIDVKFQVLRTWGGTYNGVGKYLTSVTTEPLLVNVFWGYKFTMDALVPRETVTNVGTAEAPVAALIHNLHWRIQTVIKDLQGTDVFYMQGDGLFKKMGGPTAGMNTANAERRAQEMLAKPIPWQ